MPKLTSYIAEYDGDCAYCNGDIYQGDEFVWGNVSGERLHPGCTEALDHFAPPSAQSVEDVLGEGGILVKALGLTPRPGQIMMANAVRSALRNNTNIIAEAGTGVGKSIAYLTPLILEGRRAIISTHVKPLQLQIANDLPRLTEAMMKAGISNARKVTWTILKGRGNYFCLHARDTVNGQIEERQKKGQPLDLFDAATMESLSLVDQWNADTTETGDLDELRITPLARAMLTVSSDECLGTPCTYFKQCWAEKALARANKVALVITNHKLFMTDLVVRMRSNGMASILPPTMTAVIDEAHHLESVASETFGEEITMMGWIRGRRHIERILNGPTERELRSMQAKQHQEWLDKGGNPMDYVREGEEDASTYKADEDTLASWQKFFERTEAGLRLFLTPIETRIVRNPDNVDGQGTTHLTDQDRFSDEVLRDMVVTAREMDPERVAPPRWMASVYHEKWGRQGRWLEEFARKLKMVSGRSDHEMVRYATRERTTMRVEALPVDVSELLNANLFLPFKSVTSTSATLSFGSNPKKAFDHWRGRVGCYEGEAILAPSPFPYAEHALIYAPPNQGKFRPPRQDATDDEKAAYFDRVAAEAAWLIDAAGGGVFFLFTSRVAMRSVSDRLMKMDRPWASDIAVQNENMSREAMTEDFKKHGNGVLCGVASFWEGVDIPGERLRMVIIDRIPFPVPTDPIHSAREAAYKANNPDGDAFSALSLPYASTRIKQGAGRLIRSISDKGVLVMMDGRFLSAGYSAVIQAALPPTEITTDRDEVITFLQKHFPSANLSSPGALTR